jgi:hypothetical protein
LPRRGLQARPPYRPAVVARRLESAVGLTSIDRLAFLEEPRPPVVVARWPSDAHRPALARSSSSNRRGLRRRSLVGGHRSTLTRSCDNQRLQPLDASPLQGLPARSSSSSHTDFSFHPPSRTSSRGARTRRGRPGARLHDPPAFPPLRPPRLADGMDEVPGPRNSPPTRSCRTTQPRRPGQLLCRPRPRFRYAT